jgi:CRISPR-associated protein Cmx8
LTLVVDRDGMQSLFDDLYDATTSEALSASKWKGLEPKRVEDVDETDKKTGKVRRGKRFVYDVVVPKGAIVEEWDAAIPPVPKLWLKLWRDLVWSTLRGVAAQREPYNARAEKRATDDGRQAWDELAARADQSVGLPSTYALGAQATSAENVAFQDVARARFLLHFWPIVAAIYVPAIEDRDGKREFAGYALAMPDVATLDRFVDAWETLVRGRGSEAAGYLPREAVVELPGEAGLDVVRRTNDVLATKQGSGATRPYLTGVDVFHVEKEGNNVRLRAVARIVPERAQIDEYARVRGAGYWSGPFRRQRMTNVLERAPWWHGFGRVAATRPIRLAFDDQRFRHDCRSALTEVEMKDVQESEETLEHVVYKRVQSYVLGRTERKYQLTWDKVKGNPAKEKDYNDKREKIGREAFLAVRSRTGADFVTYFTTTICSIPQHATEAKYIELARALLDPKETEKVRSLTLLALSALS